MRYLKDLWTIALTARALHLSIVPFFLRLGTAIILKCAQHAAIGSSARCFTRPGSCTFQRIAVAPLVFVLLANGAERVQNFGKIKGLEH